MKENRMSRNVSLGIKPELITLGLGVAVGIGFVLNNICNSVVNSRVREWNTAVKDIKEFRQAGNDYDAQQVFDKQLEGTYTFNRINAPDNQIPTDTISLVRSNLYDALTNRAYTPTKRN